MSSILENDFPALREALGSGILSEVEFRGENTLNVSLEALPKALALCKEKLGYELLLDVSSLDHFGEDPRFEIVYELASLDDKRHLRLKAKVSEDESVPTAVHLWKAADWHEREVWDMMGIPFADHPNLKRILMWEGYPFFPLRKDFPLAGRPSEMPDVASTGVAPLEGGPFVTSPSSENNAKREPRARHQE
ncbi:MAG: NADH-quinone oxidoreductase subunit C [Akkermansiaceae bacterium]|jgi:NADH-quinone oxidoreductase subunit C|nr:NADH-quinone oxidoreductase subunit C [Akkermansiaceae bacterium]MDP4647945.1 NADH-quinone oxidoreductase subunit C [Akkermansiaceae bacterium]MDP4719735.1 NADH-quinone oxidoreductase subunit C [Akkermansiaceae bacterium]MDP4781290.1 NADH-quinone oxidoreductase subunit C [Akkermansiaceae bacterium]MDP4846046.1 NADH-quinone oxidoreductase subunit C [Akkermansiaceae bacterium]